MSAAPIPQTRPQGSRPPIVPPNQTTFSGGYDGPEPYHEQVERSVRQLMNQLETASTQDMPSFIEPIHQRKRLVNKALTAERLMHWEVLPPLISNMYEVDFGESSSREKLYAKLLEELDAAEARIQSVVRLLNQAEHQVDVLDQEQFNPPEASS